MRDTLRHIRAYLSASGNASDPVDPHAPGREAPPRARPVALRAPSQRARAAVYLVRLGIRILKQWARDKCPQQAAALAFTTALSLVPVFAIAFSLLKGAGSLDAESRLSDFLATRLLPGMDDITDRLQHFSANISVGALGGLGLFFTLITCYSLYNYVERIFNDIWRVGPRRALVGKFLTFYAMVTLLPALASVSLYWSGRLIGAGAAARFLVPVAIQIVGLVLMNKLLPRTQVAWRSALAGALFTAFALEAGKFAFVRYAKKILLESYSGVYGSLGLIPLLLVWIYGSWLLVLLGAEIAFALQNLRVLEAEDRRQRDDEPMNGLVAVQILSFVAAAHELSGAATPRARLVAEFGLTADGVERILDRLKARGLVAEVLGERVGLIPGRAANRIALEEVLGLFRTTDFEIAEGKTSPALHALALDLERARQARTQGMTLADLFPDPRGGGGVVVGE